MQSAILSPQSSRYDDATQSEIEDACEHIGDILRRLAQLRARGIITEEQFTGALLRVEAYEVRPHGLALVATNTIDDWTVFELRYVGAGERCAGFEFRPETGEFRRVGSGPRASP